MAYDDERPAHWTSYDRIATAADEIAARVKAALG